MRHDTSLPPSRPDRLRFVNNDGLDEIAFAFSEIIDAKSPYTYRHSSRVAEYARALAINLGYDADEQRRIFRAGLLHDIGKLGVSNSILDKNGAPTAAERQQIRQHPKHALTILSQVDALATSRGRRPFTTRNWMAVVIRGD